MESSEFSNLTIEELYDIYKKEPKDESKELETFEAFAYEFDVPLTKKGKIHKRKKHQSEEARQKIIKRIESLREEQERLEKERLEEQVKNLEKQLKPATKQFPPAPKIDESKVKSPEDVELKKIPEEDKQNLDNREFERKDEILRQFINEKYPPPAPPNMLAEDAKANLEVYGESPKFRKAHNNMNFNEYRMLAANANKEINEMKKYLNSDSKKWYIDFSKLNTYAKTELKPYFLDWFVNKIGSESIKNHYIISYLVGGE